MKKITSYILLLLLLNGCDIEKRKSISERNIQDKEGGVYKQLSETKKSSNPNYSEEAIRLNNEAITFINKGDRAGYIKATELCDSAISLDPTYYLAYANKAMALNSLNKHQESIQVLTHLVTDVKKDYAEGIVLLGMLYDKYGNDSIARKYYQEAVYWYDVRIQKEGSIYDQINRAHVIYFLDSIKGLSIIDSLVNKYPNNQELHMLREGLFIDYNHQKALDDL